MKRKLTRISLLEANSGSQKGFRSAVSLHCHTHRSKEDLDFVPRYASRIPILASFFDRERERYFRLHGKIMDFAGWYWTPPVPVRAVLESESKRIEKQLDLKPLISMTDHNDISTARFLKTVNTSQDGPISLEWSVPVDGGLLHLGVHNLPSGSSTQIVDELRRHTRNPDISAFDELLELLNQYPETLVVLNHPFSDLWGLGSGRFERLVKDFLTHHNGNIHALEINGYRPRGENRAAVALAEQYGLPLVSGGDRHGSSPNALLNLTKAESFSEFVSEVRYDKVSEVLVMPEYLKDLLTRKVESVADFFRFYPEYPHGQQRWTDRVFIQLEEGVVRPLSNYWEDKAPVWVKSAMWLIRLVESEYVQPALGMAFSRKPGVPFWERIRAMPSSRG
jgi:hypothetical protein